MVEEGFSCSRSCFRGVPGHIEDLSLAMATRTRTAPSVQQDNGLLLIIISLIIFLGSGAMAGRSSSTFTVDEAEVKRVREQEQLHLNIEKHLKRLNKPAVKSIQSPDGDTIDCVHISHQPALDHPLLQNHTIQMRPNVLPDGLFTTSKAARSKGPAMPQVWHQNGECPSETIPIRRTRKRDILRASSIENFGRKNSSFGRPAQPKSADPDLLNESGHQHAITYVEGDKYYGAKATINVWEPNIQLSNEFSLSQLWILAGSFDGDLNSIEAGWQVSPDLYGDNNTRLFTYWTSDSYQATGCYNLLCSGFIQISSDIAMGATISPVSNYGGSQYDISILIWKDPKEGNWWMQFGNDYVLGYWPAPLFSYLADSASMIEWGGEVVNSEPDGQHTSTEMGSGHFPDEGFGKSSYFRNIQIVDGSNNLRAPKGLNTFTEQSKCYNVQKGYNSDWGNYFYYGGPGKSSNCP
uniref:TSA: Wollemia nobilis Ref_Wollemi_Transcript_18594_2027 transcribed RNA sequence n=1 Tax=Wollemia nobilis TaxID=56998 RepID=A0A0C9RRT3_9CONI